MINWSQTWFNSHCDSNWEHGSGVKIETINNPGWSVQIDMNGTNILLHKQDWELFELSDVSWVEYKVGNNIYFASGDPLQLELLIRVFRMIIESGIVEHSFIIEKWG